MAAVVEFISNAVNSVVEAVGDVVQAVGNFVVQAVETVATVVENVIRDPIPTLLAIAGQAIGIPYPVTIGLVTAARGGDIEDVILSAGAAYFAPTIAGPVAGTISSTLVDAGVNAAVSNALGTSISSGLVNGTIAEIKGGDFEKGFSGGFVGGMVNSGVNEVASYVKPSVMEFAAESGIDLQTAGDVFKAGTRAVGAGIGAEVRGGDFATAFTNSAIGSGIDTGVRSLNSSIDEQFRTAATDWNEKDKQSEPVNVSTTGAGIPDEMVTQVQVSETGFDVSSIGPFSNTDKTATSDISVLPETQLAQAPQAETINDFADIIDTENPIIDTNVLAEAPVNTTEVPESVIDIAEALPEAPPVASTEPVGGLNALAETATPTVGLDTSKPSVVSEAPVAENLLTTGLAPDQPVGGLNAVAQTTPEEKMATSMGLKPTDFIKPLVATAGNLLKNSLTQPKRPASLAPMRPVGGLQMAGAKPVQRKAPPPQRMDVANLIPIQRAAPPTTTVARTAPPKTLPKGANLTPITNIASLTSLVKKGG